jgi:hypothetical protein
MQKLGSERRKYLERATLQYAEHLEGAAEWLEGRGLDLEFAKSRGLGVVRNPLPGHEPAEGYLFLPYLTNRGPVNANMRCIQDHNCKEVPNHSKYWRQKGSGVNLYGVQSVAYAEDWIVVTEGEIDALTWQQIGVPALAVPGAENWKEHWANLLEDFSRVYLAEDGDSAGKDLWIAMSEHIDQGNTMVVRMRMPDGEDTNSMYLKHGKEYLLGRIKK